MPKTNAIRIRPQRITAKLLKKINACETGTAKFNRLFPDGLTLTPGNIALAVKKGLGFQVGWLAHNTLKGRNLQKYIQERSQILDTAAGSYPTINWTDPGAYRTYNRAVRKYEREVDRLTAFAFASLYNAQESRRKARQAQRAAKATQPRLKRAA